MKFAGGSRSSHDARAAMRDICDAADASLEREPVHLVVAFFTSHFEDDADAIATALAGRYPSAVVLGCSAEGVIGGDDEHERVPAVAALLASLEEATLTPFQFSMDDLDDLSDASRWTNRIGVAPDAAPTFLLFGDPFTVPVNPVLEGFNAAYPARPVIGGMASGAERPGQSVLIAGGATRRDGAVGVALSGAIECRSIVSQGCRPIGQPFVITKAEQNIIVQLGGKPALVRLHEVLQNLSPTDAALVRQALFVGRVINEYQESFSRGDFLIRNLVGIDPKSGALAVGDEMRVGATVQFHVRDHVSADEDLRQMLEAVDGVRKTAGALLFSCNGRGTRMWQEPNHDVSVLRELCGPIPVAGFFAAGELGPIGGRNFIHGHTASVVLFRERPAAPNA